MEKIKKQRKEEKQRASAEFFQLLWENAPPNIITYHIASILLILFQTGFIFSKELSAIYLSSEMGKANQMKQKILREDSILNTISGFFDIIILSRSLSSSVLTFILGLIFVFMLTVALSFYNFGTIKRWINYKKSIRNKNLFIVSFSTMMMNYDIFFFVMTIIGFNSLPCRWIWVSEKVGAEENYLEANSFENEQFDGWQNTAREQMVLKQVNYLNDAIMCKSNQHLFLIGLGVFILVLNIFLKYMANKLMRFLPSYKVFACKYGNSDLVLDLILIIIAVTKTISFIIFRENYQMIRLVFPFFFIILISGYAYLIKSKPYYNQEQHKLKCFQVLYLLNLTWFSILIRETSFSTFNSEISMIIFMGLSMTMLIKFNKNLSKINIQSLIQKTRGAKVIDPKDLLNIYYLIIDFIRMSFDKNTKDFLTGDPRVDDAAFLIKYLMEQHKTKCSKVYCYCRKSEITFKISNLEFFKDKIKGTMIFQALMLLDELMLQGIKNYGNKDRYLVYCYSNFLVSYLGRPAFAHSFITNRIHFLVKENVGLTGKKVEVELYSLLCLLDRVAWKNLDQGSLSLVALNKQIGDYNKKANKMRILQHVLFLNKHEDVKEDVVKAMELKLDFLKMIRNGGDLFKCYNISKEFYILREKIMKGYDHLITKSQKKYSPLLFTYGYFMLNCGQNRVMASGLLKEYNRIMLSACNLNRIFSDVHFRDKELVVIHASGDGEDFHKIIYSSSNVFKWIGK